MRTRWMNSLVALALVVMPMYCCCLIGQAAHADTHRGPDCASHCSSSAATHDDGPIDLPVDDAPDDRCDCHDAVFAAVQPEHYQTAPLDKPTPPGVTAYGPPREQLLTRFKVPDQRARYPIRRSEPGRWVLYRALLI